MCVYVNTRIHINSIHILYLIYSLESHLLVPSISNIPQFTHLLPYRLTPVWEPAATESMDIAAVLIISNTFIIVFMLSNQWLQSLSSLVRPQWWRLNLSQWRRPWRYSVICSLSHERACCGLLSQNRFNWRTRLKSNVVCCVLHIWHTRVWKEEQRDDVRVSSWYRFSMLLLMLRLCSMWSLQSCVLDCANIRTITENTSTPRVCQSRHASCKYAESFAHSVTKNTSKTFGH